ncbi:hypothetical protein FRC09_018661, partial [Ceratobasidium sp. 395]
MRNTWFILSPSVECSEGVLEENFGAHLASGCELKVVAIKSSKQTQKPKSTPLQPSKLNNKKKRKDGPIAPIFQSRRSSPSPPPISKEIDPDDTPIRKRTKTSKDRLADVAPLAERMRPKTLDDL